MLCVWLYSCSQSFTWYGCYYYMVSTLENTYVEDNFMPSYIFYIGNEIEKEWGILCCNIIVGTPFSHTSRALIMINLEDRDNKPPEFYWKTYTATIKENSPAGSSVVKVKNYIESLDAKIPKPACILFFKRKIKELFECPI